LILEGFLIGTHDDVFVHVALFVLSDFFKCGRKGIISF